MKNKNRLENALDPLLTGKALLLSEIAKMVSDSTGEEIKIQYITRLMAKLRSTWTFEIGYFIKKNKTSQGYIFQLVPEILNLAPEEIYGLIRKTGKDRFTLEMALEKIPELRQYVKKTIKIKRKAEIKEPPVEKKAATMKPAKKSATSQVKASVKKSKAKAKKTVLEIDPELQEPEIQAATVEDIVSIFLNEIEKIRGLKVNMNLNVRMLKAGGTFISSPKKPSGTKHQS
ncbi:MAG: hypothetical protein WA081_17580 [Desulfosalsimonadaceae bacterium]